MVRWQPPPPGAQNGELTGYKIRYRKAGRKGDAAEIITNQLSQLVDGRFNNHDKVRKSVLCVLCQILHLMHGLMIWIGNDKKNDNNINNIKISN